MLKIFKRNKEAEAAVTPKTEAAPPAPAVKKSSWLSRLRHGLSRTRQGFSEGLSQLVLGKKHIDDDLLEDIEMQLLSADLGVNVTAQIIKQLTQQVARKRLSDPQALLTQLQSILTDMLTPCEQALAPNVDSPPMVILMVGINGAGKTTTIGKLAKQLQQQGQKVMLAAGDTFRAAAVEQLKVWGERNDIPVIAQQTGADSAAVIFDAIQAAKARQVDILIADTAGRLHTQDNLMDELRKIKRVMQKVDAATPHEVMLVLDASIGQNALQQAKQFNQAVNITGITITKLDGTAKGGILFALADELKLPIRYIGIGEQIDDLRPFKAEEFVAALFNQAVDANDDSI